MSDDEIQEGKNWIKEKLRKIKCEACCDSRKWFVTLVPEVGVVFICSNCANTKHFSNILLKKLQENNENE